MAEPVKEFKEFVKFVAALGNGIGKTFEDGKFSLTELIHFLPAAQLSGDAIDGIEHIPDAITEASEEELNDIRDYLVKELDIPNDKLEATIESAWLAAFQLLTIVRAIIK